MTRGKLTDEMRTFVVHRLACFEEPSAVTAEIAREFGIEITRHTIEGYDPTKRAGPKRSPKWRSLFQETRKAFLTDSASIGVSHRVSGCVRWSV